MIGLRVCAAELGWTYSTLAHVRMYMRLPGSLLPPNGGAVSGGLKAKAKASNSISTNVPCTALSLALGKGRAGQKLPDRRVINGF